MTPKVVIYFDKNGDWQAFAEGDVEVFCVDDGTPPDRTFRMSPEPIPSGMIGDEIGYSGDGSPAEIRALRAKAELSGERHLKPIE